MRKRDNWIELKSTLKLFIAWMVTSVINSLFIALWIAIQWLVNNKIIAPLILTGIDKLVLLSFQLLFAISTLAPVAITIYRDIIIMLLRTQRRIRKESEIE